MIPKRLASAALLLLALSSDSAAAQSVPSACTTLAQGFLKGAITDPGQVHATDQGCQFSNIQVKLSRYQSWTVDQLTISGLENWDRKASPLPPHLLVSARGVRFAPAVDDSHMRYQMRLTQRPFDARLDAGFDPASQQLSIHELAIESPWIGHIGLGIDAVYRAEQDKHAGHDLPDLPALRLSHTRLVLDNKTLFEGMLMPAIIAFVPADQDPAVAFPRWQKKTEAQLRELPNGLLDHDSREALIRFIRDFPHPTGHFAVDVSFVHPISPGAIKAGKDHVSFLKDTKISVVYQPAPAQP